MPELNIMKSFSQAAGNYDANARIQTRTAHDLLSLSVNIAPTRVLDVGCGAGLYTRMLLDAFPDAEVTGIDISDGMISVAQEQIQSKRVSFVCADAETFGACGYGLITSNASFHWFRDLRIALSNVYKMLDDGGCLTFSYFGPDTYHELRESLDYVTRSSCGLACSSFMTVEEITNVLGSAFQFHTVEEQEYREDFASLRELLNNIKLTGTRGTGCDPRIAWTRGLLSRLEEAYLDRYGRISATYQVYMCRASK